MLQIPSLLTPFCNYPMSQPSSPHPEPLQRPPDCCSHTRASPGRHVSHIIKGIFGENQSDGLVPWLETSSWLLSHLEEILTPSPWPRGPRPPQPHLHSSLRHTGLDSVPQPHQAVAGFRISCTSLPLTSNISAQIFLLPFRTFQGHSSLGQPSLTTLQKRFLSSQPPVPPLFIPCPA